jgi:hypothetical protein
MYGHHVAKESYFMQVLEQLHELGVKFISLRVRLLPFSTLNASISHE